MKNIIITGASSGVGLNLCRRLCGENNVFGISRSPEPFQHKHYTHWEIDLSKLDSINIPEDLEFDALINAAAIFHTGPLYEQDEQNIIDMINTNLTGLILLTRVVLPKMNPDGNIINISSVSGTYGIKHQAVYSATKHALNGFSDALNKETSVKVTTICPGGINTPLWNDQNPYSGDVNKLIDTRELSDLVEFILINNHTTYKHITLFPNTEIH